MVQHHSRAFGHQPYLHIAGYPNPRLVEKSFEGGSRVSLRIGNIQIKFLAGHVFGKPALDDDLVMMFALQAVDDQFSPTAFVHCRDRFISNPEIFDVRVYHHAGLIPRFFSRPHMHCHGIKIERQCPSGCQIGFGPLVRGPGFQPALPIKITVVRDDVPFDFGDGQILQLVHQYPHLFRHQTGIAKTLDVQIALEYGPLNCSGRVQPGMKTIIRTHFFESHGGGKYFHVGCRRKQAVAVAGVDHLLTIQRIKLGSDTQSFVTGLG